MLIYIFNAFDSGSMIILCLFLVRLASLNLNFHFLNIDLHWLKEITPKQYDMLDIGGELDVS